MRPKSSAARLKTVKKYDTNNTKGFYIKLNLKKDMDIISFLDKQENKQGYIKSLIRSDMQRNES